MIDENTAKQVEEALNPETFNLLDYLDDQPVAEHTVDIYTNHAVADRIVTLVEQRKEELARRKRAGAKGQSSGLGLGDEDDDTEYDNEINELVEKSEKSKLTFHLKSVAPALEKAIRKSYVAKMDKDLTAAEKAEYEDKMYSDILVRAIDHVVRGDGAVDKTEWTPERLKATQEKLHDSQTEKLLNELARMVYVGTLFEDALTADFS